MSKAFKHILLFSVLLAVSAGMYAQNLPSLNQQAGIQSGRFANGISYYIVPNTTSKGYANFALIQKGADNQDAVRASLSYDYLSSKGIGYTPDGYISYAGGSAIFNFEDVPTFQSVALDSTIILLFNIINHHKGEQAIIACGDLDAAKLKDRLYIMSLTVPKRVPADESSTYIWEPSSRAKFSQHKNACDSLSEIKITYSSSRIPSKYMGTPQPLVTAMYARQMGYILRKRIEALFADKGIPLGYVEFNYVDSAHTDGDELFGLVAGVYESDIAVSNELIASVLADLDKNGVSANEFLDAKSRFTIWDDKTAASSISNKEFVDMCTANYVYGAGMSSRKEIINFFRGRKIAIEQDLSMFNRFVSALIDPARNLSAQYSTPSGSVDIEALQTTFQQAWKAQIESTSYLVRSGDTLALYYPVDKKMKVKTESTDPQTGGTVWTFANGIKVVFRKTSDSQIRYAMMIRGGYTEVPGIQSGESAFVGDMLGLYDVCGMSPLQFRNMLEANGITMNCRVSIADMRLTGTAPANKLGLVFRSILSIQKNRSLNKASFDYYRRCEALRQEDFRMSKDGINAVTDSIMCPDFFYPSIKSVEKLGEKLPENAESYFAAQFEKCQDGLIFIEGNLDPYALQKYLVRTLGSFHANRSFSVRPKVPYQMRSGSSIYTIDRSDQLLGEGAGANVAMAVEMPFTMQNWCAFRIAVEHVRRELVRDLAPLGQHFGVVAELKVLPVERFALYINCSPCPQEGVPADAIVASPAEVMNRLRESLDRISVTPLSAVALKGLKEALAQEMAGEVSDPDYVMDAFLFRNSEGKDVLSNYSTYLAKVSAEDVSYVISSLESGSKVEYVIK